MERGAIGNCPTFLLRDCVRGPDCAAPPGPRRSPLPPARRTHSGGGRHRALPGVPDCHATRGLLLSGGGRAGRLAELDVGAPSPTRNEFRIGSVEMLCACARGCYATRFP